MGATDSGTLVTMDVTDNGSLATKDATGKSQLTATDAVLESPSESVIPAASERSISLSKMEAHRRGEAARAVKCRVAGRGAFAAYVNSKRDRCGDSRRRAARVECAESHGLRRLCGRGESPSRSLPCLATAGS